MTNNLYLATNPLTDENFANVLRQIESYKPRVIRCYPDPLLLLARYKRVHPEFAWSPVAITTTGNTLFPETRKEIEEAWGCKVFDSYSCEGNSCVFECPTHTCYHSTEEYGISEVVDEQEIPLKKGLGDSYQRVCGTWHSLLSVMIHRTLLKWTIHLANAAGSI